MVYDELAAERAYRRLRDKVSADRLVPYELFQLRQAINGLSENMGKWLAAIALAASTPNDNSAEVQKLIDEQAVKLDRDATAITDALNQINQTKET